MAATMGGCDKSYYDKLKAQGKKTVTPSTFARNSLSMGGVNSDLGGGAPQKVKTSAGTSKKGKAMTGTSKA